MRKTGGGLALTTATLLAATFLAGAAQTVEVRCDGTLDPDGTGACAREFRLAHFDERDDIDYDGIVAHLVSPLASNWRVAGEFRDASGVRYFSWLCEGTLGSLGTQVLRQCESHRPALVNPAGGYYDVDTSGPQKVRVEASADACAPDPPALACAFEAHVSLLLHESAARGARMAAR